jgi:hypothetical protein
VGGGWGDAERPRFPLTTSLRLSSSGGGGAAVARDLAAAAMAAVGRPSSSDEEEDDNEPERRDDIVGWWPARGKKGWGLDGWRAQPAQLHVGRASAPAMMRVTQAGLGVGMTTEVAGGRSKRDAVEQFVFVALPQQFFLRAVLDACNGGRPPRHAGGRVHGAGARSPGRVRHSAAVLRARLERRRTAPPCSRRHRRAEQVGQGAASDRVGLGESFARLLETRAAQASSGPRAAGPNGAAGNGPRPVCSCLRASDNGHPLSPSPSPAHRPRR